VKTPIDLETTVFDFTALVNENDETTRFLDKTGKVQNLSDFCTVLVGWDKITDPRWKTMIVEILELESRKAPIFFVPESWRMAHIMRALGAFTSVGEARRNGWDLSIEEGLNDHVCRIRKVRGVVSVFRVTESMLKDKSWEVCSDALLTEPCVTQTTMQKSPSEVMQGFFADLDIVTGVVD
jgi:hypothetical protein